VWSMSERIRNSYDDALYKSTYTVLYFTVLYTVCIKSVRRFRGSLEKLLARLLPEHICVFPFINWSGSVAYIFGGTSCFNYSNEFVDSWQCSTPTTVTTVYNTNSIANDHNIYNFFKLLSANLGTSITCQC